MYSPLVPFYGAPEPRPPFVPITAANETTMLSKEREKLRDEKYELTNARARAGQSGMQDATSRRLFDIDVRLSAIKLRIKELVNVDGDTIYNLEPKKLRPNIVVAPSTAKASLTPLSELPKDFVLRAAQDTKAEALAPVIISRIREYGFAQLSTTGSKSLHVAVKALVEARGLAAIRNWDLTCQPHYGDTDFTDEDGYTYTTINWVITRAGAA